MAQRQVLPEVRGSAKRNVLAILAATGVAVLAVPLVMTVGGPPTEVLSGCPPRPSGLALIVGEVVARDRGASVVARYAVFDPKSGALRGATELGVYAEADVPICRAAPDGMHNLVVDRGGRARLADTAAANLASDAPPSVGAGSDPGQLAAARARPLPWVPAGGEGPIVVFERERMIAVEPRAGGRLWIASYRYGAAPEGAR